MKYLIAVPLLALCACASGPTPPPADGKTVAAARCDAEPVTGSRLRSCTGSSSVRTIGSATAQEDALRVQSISNVTGARSN